MLKSEMPSSVNDLLVDHVVHRDLAEPLLQALELLPMTYEAQGLSVHVGR